MLRQCRLSKRPMMSRSNLHPSSHDFDALGPTQLVEARPSLSGGTVIGNSPIIDCLLTSCQCQRRRYPTQKDRHPERNDRLTTETLSNRVLVSIQLVQGVGRTHPPPIPALRPVSCSLVIEIRTEASRSKR